MKHTIFLKSLLSLTLVLAALFFTGCPQDDNGAMDPSAQNGAFYITKAVESEQEDTEDERDDCLNANQNNPTLCDSLVDRINDLELLITDLDNLQQIIPAEGITPDPDVPDPCTRGNCIAELSELQSLYFHISLAPVTVEILDEYYQVIGASYVNDQPSSQTLINNASFVHTVLNIGNATYQGVGTIRIQSGQEIYEFDLDLIP